MLKRSLAILITFCLALVFLSAVAIADVWVSGYYRKDGTYVRGHYRSDPDGNPYNNWSYPGNINPHTGKIAPGNPDTYLKNYYNKRNKKTYSNYEPTPSSQKSYPTPSISAHSYRIRGRSYYRNGEFDLAIKEYNQALTLNPNSPYIYNDRGMAYSALKKVNEAIADYTQAIRLYPGLAEAYYNRAVGYLKLGKYDKALQDLYQAKYLFWDQEDKVEAEEFIQEIKMKN